MVASLAVLGMMCCQEGECAQRLPKPNLTQHYSQQTRTFEQIPFATKTDGSVLKTYDEAKNDVDIKRDYRDEIQLYENMKECGLDLAKKEYASYLPGDIGNTLDYLKMLKGLTVKSYSAATDERFGDYVEEMMDKVFPNRHKNNDPDQHKKYEKVLPTTRHALSSTLLANKSKIVDLIATKNWVEKSLVQDGMTLVHDIAVKLATAGDELNKDEVDREALNNAITTCNQKLIEATAKRRDMLQHIQKWNTAVGINEGTKLKTSLDQILETLHSLETLTISILKKLTGMLKKYDVLMGAYYDVRGDAATYVAPKVLTESLNETAPGLAADVDTWKEKNVKGARYRLDLSSTETKADGYYLDQANEPTNRKAKMTAEITAGD